MMAPKKLHHVAVAVDKVDDALKFYRETLGLEDITVMNLEDRGLRVALIKAGLSEIELLEPLDDNGTVARFLDRRGPGLHHVCFEVEDVEKSMRYYEGRGATFLDPVPRPGAVGLVSFMPPTLADGVLVELAQTSGYTLPSDEEPEPVPETIETPEITQPILRGPGGYTRAGQTSAITARWGEMPEPAAPPEAAAAPTDSAWPTPDQPGPRGPSGYTRSGLGNQAPTDGWPSASSEPPAASEPPTPSDPSASSEPPVASPSDGDPHP
jgi:methylmalonyl-CoA epimerase